MTLQEVKHAGYCIILLYLSLIIFVAFDGIKRILLKNQLVRNSKFGECVSFYLLPVQKCPSNSVKFSSLRAILSRLKQGKTSSTWAIFYFTTRNLFFYIVPMETVLRIIPWDDITQFHVPSAIVPLLFLQLNLCWPPICCFRAGNSLTS